MTAEQVWIQPSFHEFVDVKKMQGVCDSGYQCKNIADIDIAHSSGQNPESDKRYGRRDNFHHGWFSFEYDSQKQRHEGDKKAGDKSGVGSGRILQTDSLRDI